MPRSRSPARRPAASLLAVVVLAMLLAGCLAPSPPFSARHVPDEAPQEGGPGDRPVTIHVRTEDGPVPARVVAWWVDRETRHEDGRILHATGVALFGPAGNVVAHVPADQAVHVAAATDGQRTEEWIFDAVPPGTEPARVEVRVYDVERRIVVDDVWQERLLLARSVGPAAAEVYWYPVDVPFSSDPGWDAGYEARVASVDGALHWDNDALHFADLGILVGGSQDPTACHLQDDDPDLALGPRTQTFRIPDDAPCPSEEPPPGTGAPMRLGPATDSHSIALDGMPFQIDARAKLFPWNGWQGHVDRFAGATLEMTWAGAAPTQAGPASRPTSSTATPPVDTPTLTGAIDPAPRPTVGLHGGPEDEGAPMRFIAAMAVLVVVGVAAIAGVRGLRR